MSQAISNELSNQGLQLVPRAPLDLNLLPEASQGPQPAEEPSNPRTRARGRSSPGEGRVREERLPVPAGRHLSSDQQGRAG
jgi:hypothetical protein